MSSEGQVHEKYGILTEIPDNMKFKLGAANLSQSHYSGALLHWRALKGCPPPIVTGRKHPLEQHSSVAENKRVGSMQLAGR